MRRDYFRKTDKGYYTCFGALYNLVCAGVTLAPVTLEGLKPLLPQPLLPLVVGPPRSGFTLLISVLVHLAQLGPSKRDGDLRQCILKIIADTVGWSVSDAVVDAISSEGLADDLVYNRNFRELTGGPRWIEASHPERACFRKYIGIRGGGDLNLVTTHPRAMLDQDLVVHSHVDPELWLKHTGYTRYRKFASIRNPIGIVNSSIFSLNALASEYIQKFLPPQENNDTLRQNQALYKMTDLDFFAGLVSHLKRYIEAFARVREGYIVMRWEDLIDHPVPTIQSLGRATGLAVTDEQADAIWKRLDHRNLTGAHNHNYREGFGIVGNWRQWLTNHHLRLIRDMGLTPLIEALGYDPNETLDETAYTPFQREVSGMIARGQVYDDYPDRDLFTFAFNKSNIDIEKFKFRRYPWRTHTRIERSCFADPALELRVWDVAETATGLLNRFLTDLLTCDFENAGSARAAIERVFHRHEGELGRLAPTRFAEAQSACLAALGFGSPAVFAPPRLVKTAAAYNIVYYGQRFYGLPQALGPVDLMKEEADGWPGVIIAGDLGSLEQRIEDLSHSI
jgi:hypothetical protein